MKFRTTKRLGYNLLKYGTRKNTQDSTGLPTIRQTRHRPTKNTMERPTTSPGLSFRRTRPRVLNLFTFVMMMMMINKPVEASLHCYDMPRSVFSDVTVTSDTPLHDRASLLLHSIQCKMKNFILFSNVFPSESLPIRFSTDHFLPVTFGMHVRPMMPTYL
jgi:hypothetical protein